MTESHIVESESAPPDRHMARDAQLLAAATRPILHHYEWQGRAATYGYFLDPFSWLCRKGVEKLELQLARRPTGGGMILHLTDLAFSVVIPRDHPGYSCNTLTNYAFVNRMVMKAIEGLVGEGSKLQLLAQEPVNFAPACGHFCMAKPTRYDVLLGGRKVGGAAQRRTRHGFLHQGSISLSRPSSTLLEQLLPGHPEVVEAMGRHTHPLVAEELSSEQLKEARCLLRAELTRAFQRAVG